VATPIIGATSTSAIVPVISGVSPGELSSSFALCRQITRRAARNFYYGLRLTPEPRRSAVYSIYAWMRRADDLVDEPAPVETRRARLAEFAHQTDRAMRGDLGFAGDAPPKTPSNRPGTQTECFWPALAATLSSYPIDQQHIRDMLAGLTEDLSHDGYATRAELDRYCYRVGSTVGLVCVAIWGLREGTSAEAAREKSIARGRAFQLTNILRDIGQDYDDLPRRVYVPREDLHRHGLTAAQLRAWDQPQACRALVMEMVERARALYAASAGLEEMIDAECAPAMWGMTRIYAGLLDVIAVDPRRVMTGPRVRLSSLQKGLIAVRAYVKARAGAWGSV
jgi:phytoene synthase